MIESTRFALNRIAAPTLGLEEFFEVATMLGMNSVELRNDIRDGSVTDGLKGTEVLRLAKAAGVRIITINALQQFNLPSARANALDELKRLLALCVEIECPALVLCPNNRPEDVRTPEQKYRDTVEALKSYAPLFSAEGILGYIEPLGFGISSLASAETALKAIRESGAPCYRLLIDTFHSYLGPDVPELFDDQGVIASIGLVHVSGVGVSIPKSQFLDAHRVLPSAADVMQSASLVARLEQRGYRGLYSFEPFSSEVQSLGKRALVEALRASMRFLAEA